MPLQKIQIGTYANDGTGDTLRVSFSKTNENFQEVYDNLGAQANNANAINVTANRSTNVIFRHANSAFDQANSAFFYATQVDDNMGYAHLKANLAFQAANGVVANTLSAFRHANASYAFANNLSIQINDSITGLRARTNLIFNYANSINSQLNDATNGLRVTTNLIYSLANTIHVKVNTNFTLTNVVYGVANSMQLRINAAFQRANSAYDYADQIAATRLANTNGVSFAGSLYFPLGSRIGVGTNAPGSALHVRSNSDNPLVILDSDGNQDLTVRFRRKGTYQWIINNENSSSDLSISTPQTSNILRLTDEGNIGVGIIPEYKLDVNGTSNFRGIAYFRSFMTVNIPSAQLNTSGVYSFNPDGIGVHGVVTRSAGGPDGSIGILGEARDGTGIKGVATTGPGAIGISTSQTGVYGQSRSGTGIHGQSLTNTTGVFGQTEGGTGVYGQSQSGTGVHGRSLGGTTGVFGQSAGGTGVAAYSATGFGVHATSGSNYSFVGGAEWNTSNFAVRASDGQIFNGSGLKPLYGCRAWVNFKGSAPITIRGSGNVTSITDGPGAGNFTINFTTPIVDANYAAIANYNHTNTSSRYYNDGQASCWSHSTTSVKVSIVDAIFFGFSAGRDALYVSVAIFR